MKRVFLALCLILICGSAIAEPAGEISLNLVDEWLIFPFMELQGYIGVENGGSYFLNDDEVAVQIDGESITLTMDGDSPFVGACILNNEKAAILTVNGDDTYVMFALSQEPLDGETRRWSVYSTKLESTALFTPTRMISDGSSLEYVFNGNSLYLVQDNDYDKGSVDVLSDNAFVWRMETDKNEQTYAYTGDYCVLFLRSSVE